MIGPDLITIEVTAEDIAKGRQGERCWCPIALALCRQFGFQPANENTSAVLVETEDFYVTFNPIDADDWEIYTSPPEARDFIENFDNGHPVSPFTFVAHRWSLE